MKPTLILLALSAIVLSKNAFTQTGNGYSTTVISSQWNQAVGLSFNKSGSVMFVWERTGKIYTVENNVKTLMLDISDEVGAYGDLGLLGFTIDPNFDVNRFIYLLYTVDRHHLMDYGTPGYSTTMNVNYNATIHRVTRYTASRISNGYTVNEATRRILIGATRQTGIPSVAPVHGPGSLLFGTDGTLLISTGDGASASSVDTGNATGTYYALAMSNGIITSQENVGAFRSQLLESYCGKVLRIDPVTGNGISSNPFFDAANPGSPRSKVWALGLRNGFRMSLKPGTGSANALDGNPGTIYLGDVGHMSWEELDVVNRPGLNFGWPIFEGLTFHTGYQSRNVYNYHAPNPAYGINGCTKRYFYFRDLIKQATASGTATFLNSCNSQPVPSTVKTFMHARPIIDWGHTATGPSRTGTFTTSGTASTSNIGASGSPVSGPQFSGKCAVGGMFYPHDDFPAGFKNTYIFADYTTRWIRNMSLTTGNAPVTVGNVIDSGAVVALAAHPVNGGIYFIDYTATIKRVRYNSNNLQPLAVSTSNKLYGPAPLTVQFDGSGSSDPEGQPLTYLWNFGDGSTSTASSPSHTFTATTQASIQRLVTLTVTDVAGAAARDSLTIYVNNEPPQVNILSPTSSDFYSMNGQSTFQLRGTAIDKEDNTDSLLYEWTVILRHDDHEHPEPVITTREATAITSPLGCTGEVYYYRFLLKVTDRAGLFSTKEVQVYPYCDRVTSFTLVNADTDQDIQLLTNGAILDLRKLGARKINIRANTNPATVQEVRFNLSGAQTKSGIDNASPYALFGDINGNYSGWNPPAGNYVLKAAPYTSRGAGGVELNISFTVAKNISVTSASVLDTSSGYGDNAIRNKASHIQVYPNPFDDYFVVDVTNTLLVSRITMYDIYGRRLMYFEKVSPGKRLNIGKDLRPGVYVLSVEAGGETHSYKLIKSK